MTLRKLFDLIFILTLSTLLVSCSKDDGGKSDLKSIVEFSIANVEGAVYEKSKTITVDIPYNADVKNMKPVIVVSPKANVVPSSGESVDFTNPVRYVVIAEDRSTQEYWVTVTVFKRDGKAITNYVVGDVVGIIDETEKTIALVFPPDSDLTKLTPTISISEGATISTASGKVVNLTEPVVYTVTAEDGKTTKYTVSATLDKRVGAKITNFKVGGIEATINEADQTITATLPVGTDLTKLLPVISISEGATISPASGKVTNFTNPVVYTVTAENGTKGKYTVTLSVAKRTDKVIIDFRIGDVTATIDEKDHTINAVLPKGYDLTKLSPMIIISEGATVSPVSNKVTNFTNPVVYTVTAEDGSTQKYTANITLAKSSEKAITSFKFKNTLATINEKNHTITAERPVGTSFLEQSPIITVSEGAKVSPASGEVTNFSNPVTYTVTAEDGSAQKYVVTLTGTKNTENSIFYFAAGSEQAIINQTDLTITCTYPIGTDLTNLKTFMEISSGAIVTPKAGETVNFTNPVKYKVTAENGVTKTYTVTLKTGAYQTEVTRVSGSRGINIITPYEDYSASISGVFSKTGNNTVNLYNSTNKYTLNAERIDSRVLECIIPKDLKPGVYTLSVTSGGVTGVYPEKVTIHDPEIPVITSLSKTSLSKSNLKKQEIVITGYNFTLSGAYEELFVGVRKEGAGATDFTGVHSILTKNPLDTEIRFFWYEGINDVGVYYITVMKNSKISNSIRVEITE